MVDTQSVPEAPASVQPAVRDAKPDAPPAAPQKDAVDSQDLLAPEPADEPVEAPPAAPVDGEQKPDEQPAKPELSLLEKLKAELPDNYEEIVAKKIPRTPEPKRTDLDQALGPFRKTIDDAIAKKGSGRHLNIRRQQIRERTRPEYNAAKKEYDTARQAFADKLDIKKPIQAALIELRNMESEGRAAANRTGAVTAHPTLKGIKNIEELDQRIHELEFKLTSQTMPIQEEKKIISDLSYLKHKGRDTMTSADRKRQQERDGRDNRRKRREDLEVEVRALDQEINQLKVVREDKRAVWEKIKDAQEKEIAEVSAEAGEVNHEELEKEIDSAKKTMKGMEDDFYAKVREAKENDRQIKNQDYLRRKVKRIKNLEDQEARKAEYEAELAQYPPPDPYETEKNMCDTLVGYLEGLQGTSTAESELAKGVGELSVAVKEGGTVIGKNLKRADDTSEMDSGMYSAFGKSGKKGKGKRQKADNGSSEKRTSSAKLPPHSIAKFDAFQKMGVSAPTTVGDIPAVIEKLKEKKKFYDAAPPPTEKQTAAKETKPKAPKESKKNNEYVPDVGPALVSNGTASTGTFSTMNFANVLKSAKEPISGPVVDAAGPDVSET